MLRKRKSLTVSFAAGEDLPPWADLLNSLDQLDCLTEDGDRLTKKYVIGRAFAFWMEHSEDDIVKSFKNRKHMMEMRELVMGMSEEDFQKAISLLKTGRVPDSAPEPREQERQEKSSSPPEKETPVPAAPVIRRETEIPAEDWPADGQSVKEVDGWFNGNKIPGMEDLF